MRRLMVMTIAVALAGPAGAQTPESANLPPDFYPRPACEKPPSPPPRPGNGDQDAIMAYNMRIKSYNARNVTFHDCIKAYVDRAQADINRIQAIVHAAVQEANKP